ncbi:hypothetical protein BAAM0499_03060 [Bifidobacterium animalis subsp. animalis MCC 0499]|uniref:hypothetical protein n=1 Tax=Bifidobacterium animalis TaxID=28025 RepID=UPI00069C24FE|nr:hypothetical protein [Bifidobacterium animalis]KOA60871.1 hypothetical protein BAAM0499_03060 [Bifidobacterium animalis subsp. animalis MCC 0499]
MRRNVPWEAFQSVAEYDRTHDPMLLRDMVAALDGWDLFAASEPELWWALSVYTFLLGRFPHVDSARRDGWLDRIRQLCGQLDITPGDR